jgi:hypothetical protein
MSLTLYRAFSIESSSADILKSEKVGGSAEELFDVKLLMELLKLEDDDSDTELLGLLLTDVEAELEGLEEILMDAEDVVIIWGPETTAHILPILPSFTMIHMLFPAIPEVTVRL